WTHTTHVPFLKSVAQRTSASIAVQRSNMCSQDFEHPSNVHPISSPHSRFLRFIEQRRPQRATVGEKCPSIFAPDSGPNERIVELLGHGAQVERLRSKRHALLISTFQHRIIQLFTIRKFHNASSSTIANTASSKTLN